MFKSSHGPYGKLTFCSLLAGRWCRSLWRHSDHLIVHHQWEHSYICACSCSKFPIAPMGKSADALASTLACTTAADASVNYSKYVPQRPQNFPLPRWDFHIWLALVLAGWRCLRPGWYGDFVIMHHQWKQSFHCAALIFKSSHRPDGISC
jgi:hypothetical protein